jgi:hypothetical protein
VIAIVMSVAPVTAQAVIDNRLEWPDIDEVQATLTFLAAARRSSWRVNAALTESLRESASSSELSRRRHQMFGPALRMRRGQPRRCVCENCDEARPRLMSEMNARVSVFIAWAASSSRTGTHGEHQSGCDERRTR